MKILIVEDSHTDAMVLQHALEHIGHEVTVVTTAEDAMTSLRSTTFPVVICDWELPGLNGDDLCRKIRQRSSINYTYIIMLTSRTEKKYVIEGLAAGADDYLTKPFEPQELFFRVRVAERLLSLQGRDLMIFSLAKLSESRDHETGIHLERMREYCRLLTTLLAKTPRFKDKRTNRGSGLAGAWFNRDGIHHMEGRKKKKRFSDEISLCSSMGYTATTHTPKKITARWMTTKHLTTHHASPPFGHVFRHRARRDGNNGPVRGVQEAAVAGGSALRELPPVHVDVATPERI